MIVAALLESGDADGVGDRADVVVDVGGRGAVTAKAVIVGEVGLGKGKRVRRLDLRE